MAYYGAFSSAYPSSYQPAAYTPMQSSLAGYGSTYRVNQPAYYAGPSYSSTSDNDYPWFNAQPSYGSPYGSGYSNGGYMGYAGSNYFANSEPYTSYTPHYTTSYQQQVVSAMPTSSQHQHSARSQSGTGSQTNLRRSGTDSQSDDLTQLAPQIEAAYEAATGQRRQSVVKRQVITIPGQPGRVQQVVRRLPTPTPDVIERVFIVKPQRDTVNLIIERPSTPPAQYKDKTVYGKQRRPLINPKIIQVPSRQNTATSSCYPYSYPQSYSPYSPYNMQALPMQQQPASTASSYQFQQQQPAMSQVSQQQQQQQYAQQPSMSQGHSSQSRSQSQLSEASQTRLSDRLSQHQLNQPQQKQKGAYIVAPVKYEESPQPSQQLSYPGTPVLPPMPTSPLSYPSYGGYSSGFGGYSSGMQSYYPAQTPVYPTSPYGTRIY